jgi:hypothetical protein
MAKNPNKEAAEEALRLIKEEAELRAKMNSSYEEYIKAVKQAHALQATLNKNIQIQNDVQSKINNLKASINNLSGQAKIDAQNELDIEEEKLEILKKQNKLMGKQVEMYKSAAKEVNVMALTLGKAGKAAYGLAGTISNLPGKIQSAIGSLQGLFEMDKAIKQSALSMGVLSKEGVGFRKNIIQAYDSTSMIGGNIKELSKLQASYSESLGRNVVLTKEGLKGLYEMSVVTGLGAEGSSQMAADMELQGYSAERTAEFTEETLNASHKMGLNATKVMKNVAGNLKLMDKYRFKEGAKGLAKMAQLVTKLGVDMNSVSGMADKLWNIEGAVEMSAQLNVMGGAWAQMADPFHLMYMARNDMKGLTEEIARASQESISFNEATGEFDLSAEGMHRLKIIAEQTGMEYQDLVTMGKNMAKFDKIKTQVGFSIGGSDEDKAMLDYISSKSMLNKNGEASIMINGEPKLLKTLSAQDKQIIQSQMAQQESMKERAEQARSFDEQFSYAIDNLKVALLPMIEAFNAEGGLGDQLDGFVKSFIEPGGWRDTIKYWAKEIGGFINSIGSWVVENKELVLGIWAFAKAVPLITTAFKLFGGVWDTIKWFKNGVSLANGFNSAVSIGGGSGFGGNGSGGSGFSLKRTGKALKGGFKQGGVKGALKAGGKSLFRQGKGAMKMAGGLGKGLLKGVGKGLLKSIPLVGSLMSLGEMGMDMFENGFSWKSLGKGLTNAAVDLIPGVGLVNSVAGGMGYGAGDLLFGDEAEDAVFNAPVKDGLFSGDNLKKSLTAMIPGIGPAMLLKDMLSTRGIIQNGKITPIDNKDDVVAMKKGGAIDKYGQTTTTNTSTIKHEFGNITIDGTIRVEGPGGQEINKNLLSDESFRRQLTKIVQDETIKRVSYGKMKG